MNPSTALARVLVDELVRHGVTDACLAPGSRSAPLALALHDDERVRLHVRIDERSAAFVAVGLARVTARPAVVVCTSGTAVANLHPAVVEAAAGGVPMILLTADRPPELRGAGANQTIDQIKLFGSATRWFCEVGVPEGGAAAVPYWRSLASRAFGEATGALGGPPGPVHLNVALREPLVPDADDISDDLDGRPGGAPWTAVGAAPRPPSPADVEWLADRVQATERGVLVVGDTSADAGPLLELAETAGWPVLAEPQSGARGGPNAVSTYDALVRDEGFWAEHWPDFVVLVGRVTLSKSLLARLDADVAQVLLDRDGAWIDPRRALARVITGDPAAAARAVCDEVLDRPDSPWIASWRDHERRVRGVVDELLDAEPDPTEPRIARDLAAALPGGALLAVASSMPARDLNSFMRPRHGLRFVANRGASGIDGFVSTAVGAAAAADGPAFALAGDLSLLHDANGLLAGHGERPDLVIVVVNNDGGGIFSFLPQADHPDGFERVFGTPHGVDLARVASVSGAGYAFVGGAAELEAVVRTAAAAGGLWIVEARTDRTANVALHRRIGDAVTAALV